MKTILQTLTAVIAIGDGYFRCGDNRKNREIFRRPRLPPVTENGTLVIHKANGNRKAKP